MNQKDVDRFMRSVEKTNSCWNWNKSTDTFGYGMFRVDGKLVNAHRFSYAISKGEIPEGLLVRHSCDNPKCVNPEHLLLGKQKDNMKDMDERGRRVVSKQFNFDNAATKLSEEDVLFIRNFKSFYGYRNYLAKMFNVSWLTIKAIRLGKRRQHVGTENGDVS